MEKSQIHFFPSELGLDEALQVEQFINSLVASRSSPQRFDLATPSGTPRGLIADALPPEAVPFAVGEVDPEYEEIIDNFFRPKLLRDFEVGIAGHDLATEAAVIIQDFWRSKCAALGVATSAPLLMPDKVLSSPLDNGANTSTPRISTPTCLSPPSSPPLLSRTSCDVHPIDMDPSEMLKLDPIDKFPVAARDVACSAAPSKAAVDKYSCELSRHLFDRMLKLENENLSLLEAARGLVERAVKLGWIDRNPSLRKILPRVSCSPALANKTSTHANQPMNPLVPI